MDASHVERVVGVCHHVAEARRTNQTRRQRPIDDSGGAESPEGVGIRRRGPEIEMQAGGRRKIDDDLRRLPQVQDHRIGSVGRRLQLLC